MEARIVFAFLVAFVLCQVICTYWGNYIVRILTFILVCFKVIFAGVPSLRERREAADDTSKTITDMLDSIKTGFDDLVKGVQVSL